MPYIILSLHVSSYCQINFDTLVQVSNLGLRVFHLIGMTFVSMSVAQSTTHIAACCRA